MSIYHQLLSSPNLSTYEMLMKQQQDEIQNSIFGYDMRKHDHGLHRMTPNQLAQLKASTFGCYEYSIAGGIRHAQIRFQEALNNNIIDTEALKQIQQYKRLLYR